MKAELPYTKIVPFNKDYNLTIMKKDPNDPYYRGLLATNKEVNNTIDYQIASESPLDNLDPSSVDLTKARSGFTPYQGSDNTSSGPGYPFVQLPTVIV